MTPCEINGILSNCGMNCKALADGDCEDKERLAEYEEYTHNEEEKVAIKRSNEIG